MAKQEITTPLFTPAQLLPLGERGGVQFPLKHTPGKLRPYAATLSVEMLPSGRHNTTSTRPLTSTPTQTSKDGVVVPDNQPDTGQDS